MPDILHGLVDGAMTLVACFVQIFGINRLIDTVDKDDLAPERWYHYACLTGFMGLVCWHVPKDPFTLLLILFANVLVVLAWRFVRIP